MKYFRLSMSRRTVGVADPTCIVQVQLTAGRMGNRRASVQATECWGHIEVRGYVRVFGRARQFHRVFPDRGIVARLHQRVVERMEGPYEAY